MLQHYKEWFESYKDKVFTDFFTFLKFRSVSTDSAYQKEMRLCADWLVNFLQNMGFNSEVWHTSGHPTVFASHMEAGKDCPTLLFYQHYDVQPASHLNEWESDPFIPTEREEKIYARGASDNKGQCFYVLSAIQAFLELTKIPKVNIKVLIEGEEEVGSPGLEGILEEKKKQLFADYVFITDLDMLGPDLPAVTLGTRGCVNFNLSCQNSDADLHSGFFGGVVDNPAQALVSALGACVDELNKVSIPDFYDGIQPLSTQERKEIYMGIDIKKRLENFNVRTFSSERNKELIEANWFKPTFEITALESGYLGQGTQNSIPSVAKAKLSCRIGNGQDPEHIANAAIAFLKKKLPQGMKVDVERFLGSKAYLCSPEAKVVKVACQAYEEVFKVPCQKILCGATIPIVTSLAQKIGGELIMMGVSLITDCIHSPNEHFDKKRFEKGFLVTCRMLEILSREENIV